MGDEFQIQIVSDADLKGFNQTAEGAKNVESATNKANEETRRSGHAAEETEPLIERLGLSHRTLHQALHLIGTSSGPEAEAAMASLGVAAGGGIGIAIAAVGALTEVFKQAKDAAEEFEAAQRAAMADAAQMAINVRSQIDQLKTTYQNFWTEFERHEAKASGQEAFENQIAGIKDLGAAAGAGLIDKGRADEYVRQKTTAAQQTRLGEQALNVNALMDQLTKAQTAATSPEAAKGDLELESLKHDLERLQEAMKSGKGFAPGPVAGQFTGQVPERTTSGLFGQDNNDEVRKQSYENSVRAIENEIEAREKAKQAQTEHIDLLQKEITARQAEIDKLREQIDKSNLATATADFAQGKKIADTLAAGGSVPVGDAQYLVVLEQAITGRKLTLEQAVKLIEMQSQNDETALQILQLHRDQISTVAARLFQLEQTSRSTAVINRTG